MLIVLLCERLEPSWLIILLLLWLLGAELLVSCAHVARVHPITGATCVFVATFCLGFGASGLGVELEADSRKGLAWRISPIEGGGIVELTKSTSIAWVATVGVGRRVLH